ncbi:hypothetical protein T642_26125 [Klebsiella pneumoniae HE12]|nr:hypothetical protein T642_26125 [Klebsiella pneumoniae HE12]
MLKIDIWGSKPVTRRTREDIVIYLLPLQIISGMGKLKNILHIYIFLKVMHNLPSDIVLGL